jgi:hypothetical protein
MKFLPGFFFIAITLFCAQATFSQAKSINLVYVDKKGVLRYTKDNKEAAFFGVNYTTPFAYAYRAHKALSVDIEKAIEQDVYQMARLGLDAFRVHVWDTEISDTAGNLLENEHLRLFDFLLAELKKRNIKTIITPIAFWGNGYPERDEVTPGFSRKYGKGRATTNDTAIVAQENYLKQFFRHINPYTKQTYVDDADVIAVELNNEPSHSGPKEAVTTYINRLAKAMKSIGWTKPLYYNIAQNPYYADAVAKANVDGVSFQWYPTGLVANHEQKGNFLPNVDHYPIPYDTIPEYRNKSKMVYEFDAADVLQSHMYPMIAKSFRETGFQWATQFAYDPTAIANVNTEYQTHYLNLLYTPSKAISLLIASKVFHKLPRMKNYGSYPSDSSFDVFRVSYKNSLSEMNSTEEFFYSNSTDTKPLDVSKLKHLAGVGSSSVVKYEGSGAYFLDRLQNGAWWLEVYPDAIHIQDPFGRASPKKEVTRLQWNKNKMQLNLPELASNFSISPVNEEALYKNADDKNSADGFYISPGIYLLQEPTTKEDLSLAEYSFPYKPVSNQLYLHHEPLEGVSAGKTFTLTAKIVGLDTATAILQMSLISKEAPKGERRDVPFLKKTSVEYVANIPKDMMRPGFLNYRIIVQKGEEFIAFPDNRHEENPFETNIYESKTWQTVIFPDSTPIQIFDPNDNQTATIYPSSEKGFRSSYLPSTEFGGLRQFLQLSATELFRGQTMGFTYFFADRWKGRTSELNSVDTLVLRARALPTQPLKVKITLVDKNAFAFSSFVTLTNQFQDLKVSLDSFTPDSILLLPRPYPSFLPLWFKASGRSSFNLNDMEKIQVTVDTGSNRPELKKSYAIEVWSICLEKKKMK